MRGRTLRDLFAGTSVDADAMQVRLAELMAIEGLPYGKRSMTFNSRMAQELAKWAERENRSCEFNRAIFHAYFVDGRNIGDMNVLLGIVGELGLPEAEASTVLTDGVFKEAVDSDWQRASDLGVTGVPTFVCSHRAVIGAQPYEVLERLVREAGATRRE